MKRLLTAIQSYDFYSQKDKKQIKGNKLHTLAQEPNLNDGLVGYMVKTFSISDGVLENLLNGKPRQEFVNKEVEISFNEHGSIETICLTGK